MSSIRYSRDARLDLAEIKNYISKDLSNPSAASSIVAKISKHIHGLKQFPELGASMSSIVDIVTDVRFLVCGNYLAFYHIQDNGIYIDRILHGKRDYVSALFGELS
jgi:addiction module RelE/StbE family toxin